MTTALEERTDSDRLQEGSGLAEDCALQTLSCSHFYLPAKCMKAQGQSKAGYLMQRKTWEVYENSRIGVGFSLGTFHSNKMK